MKFIEKIASGCARLLVDDISAETMRKIKKLMKPDSDQKKITEDTKIDILNYGAIILFGTLFELLLIVGISILLGTFKITMVMLYSFVFLRISSGGFHFDTYNKCAFVTVFLFTGIGFIIKVLIISKFYTMLIFMIVILISIMFVFRYVPKEVPGHYIKPNKKKRFKYFSLITLFIISIITVLLYYYGFTRYVLATTGGISILMFSVTPLGVKTMSVLNKMLGSFGL